MKLVPRLISSLFIVVGISFISLLTMSLNDVTPRCKNDESLSKPPVDMNTDELDASRASTSATPTTSAAEMTPLTPPPPPSKNLSMEEMKTIQKAIIISRNAFNGLPIKVEYLALPQNSDESNSSSSSEETPWTSFKRQISNIELYSETMQGSEVDELLDRLATQSIIRIRQKTGGTQLKLVVTLSDGTKALFKPMRFKREQETLPDHFYFTDYERHNAEIAAFHLDRILEFHRVPPTAGRIVNVTYDLKQLADRDLRRTFFVSPAGNVCFHGKCSYYCDTSHAVCGHPDLMEASMAAFLPTYEEADRDTYKHPWSRSYSKRTRARWQDDPMYCRNKSLITRTGRILNDLVDTAIFDFLTGNMDRHHYEMFTEFGESGYPLNLDSGRAFGRSRWDEISILAPLYQCCRIRRSTLQKLVQLTRTDNLLSDRMRRSLAKDRLPPLLTEPHLLALDRRALTVLRSVLNCLTNSGRNDVIVDDGL